MLISLSISSKNQNSLTSFLKLFYRLEVNKLLNSQSFIIQSQKKKKRFFFSVLKSPHVNKKSQDQFEWLIYKKNLKIKILRLAQFLTICKQINTQIFHDIDFKIKFLAVNSPYKHFVMSKINFDLFLLKSNKKKKFLSSININQRSLKILDFQGEMLLKKIY